MCHLKFLINIKKYSFLKNEVTIFRYKKLLKNSIFTKARLKTNTKYGKSKTL
jgi:hypothetical protein